MPSAGCGKTNRFTGVATKTMTVAGKQLSYVFSVPTNYSPTNRYALVFGAMTFAMALSGVLAEVISVTVVLAAFGLVTMATGLAGLFVAAVRDA